jgi:cobalamin-dependent methionine synthase I
MIIIGEKINTSRARVEEAVKARDAAFIVQAAREQAEAGAHFIDVNAGTFVGQEAEYLCWMVDTIQDEVDLPLALDSPDPVVLSQAMKRHRGEPMINSISLEEGRFQALLPVISSNPCHVVALCMAQTSMPTSVEERVQVGSELVKKLTGAGVPLERIYVDPLIQPVSVDTNMGLGAMGAIEKIMQEFPGVNTICGLSNISFGLPQRRIINRYFLALCISRGLSAVILDPTDKQLMTALLTAEMLTGRDEYCQNYIEAYQNNNLV